MSEIKYYDGGAGMPDAAFYDGFNGAFAYGGADRSHEGDADILTGVSVTTGYGTITATVRPEEITANDVFAGEDLAAVYSLYTDLMGKLTFLQYGLETTQTGYGVFADLCRVLDFMNGERA